jgi:hypothetical protein
MTNSESGQIPSEGVGWRKRLRRLWVSFLSNTIPYYSSIKARKGDPDVIDSEIKWAQRHGRMPDDPD